MSRAHLGHAVANGRVRFLSVSQITKFDDKDGKSGEGCRRRWFFQYVFGKKEESTTATTRGVEFAKQLECYLTTGYDALAPEVRAGKHLLPKPGPDLEVEKDLSIDLDKALKLREALFKPENAPGKNMIAREMRRFAGLVANDIPVIGAADVRHRRGEYVDEDGVLRREKYDCVVEIIDHKTTSRINAHTTKNGTTYPGYAKTVEEILNHPQTLGYARHALEIYPDLRWARVGHIYYQTRNGYAAAKRTGILSRDEVIERWSTVENVAREIENTALATRPEDVRPNINACRSYNRECPHASYCNRPEPTVAQLFQLRDTSTQTGEKMASLFDTIKKTETPTNGNGAPYATTTTMSSMTDAEYQAKKNAAHVKFAAEDAKHPLTGLEGYVVGQKCNGRGFYASSNGQGFVATERGHECENCKTKASETPILPPDAPKSSTVDSADPLPPAIVAGIEDPEIKARAEALAAARAADDVTNPKPAKKSGRCSAAGTIVALSDAEKFNQKKACPSCGAERKIKKDELTADFASWVVPNHNLPKEDKAAAAPTAPALPPPAIPKIPAMMAESPPIIPTTTEPPPIPKMFAASAVNDSYANFTPPITFVPEPTKTTTGIRLYVDVVVERGEALTSLESYVADLVKTIQDKAGLHDLRCAPDKHECGYGRWRGYLAAAVRFSPPQPGSYSLYNVGSSELKQVVLESLAPMCEVVVRGVR